MKTLTVFALLLLAPSLALAQAAGENRQTGRPGSAGPKDDGSVVQREHVQEKGYQHGTPADGLLRDGVVRIAFLRPQDVASGIGHVVLVHDAKTFESHGGVGPDSRPWTNTGWQAKTLVYVLTPAG